MVPHAILCLSLLATPGRAESWPGTIAKPDLTGSLLPHYWEATRPVVVALRAESRRVGLLLWPREGAAVSLLDDRQRVQLTVQVERYGQTLLAAVYLRRQEKGDFLELVPPRDINLPLLTFRVQPDRWAEIQLQWSDESAGAVLECHWGSHKERIVFPGAKLTPCTWVSLAPGTRFAHLGFEGAIPRAYP